MVIDFLKNCWYDHEGHIPYILNELELFFCRWVTGLIIVFAALELGITNTLIAVILLSYHLFARTAIFHLKRTYCNKWYLIMDISLYCVIRMSISFFYMVTAEEQFIIFNIYVILLILSSYVFYINSLVSFAKEIDFQQYNIVTFWDMLVRVIPIQICDKYVEISKQNKPHHRDYQINEDIFIKPKSGSPGEMHIATKKTTNDKIEEKAIQYKPGTAFLALVILSRKYYNKDSRRIFSEAKIMDVFKSWKLKSSKSICKNISRFKAQLKKEGLDHLSKDLIENISNQGYRLNIDPYKIHIERKLLEELEKDTDFSLLDKTNGLFKDNIDE